MNLNSLLKTHVHTHTHTHSHSRFHKYVDPQDENGVVLSVQSLPYGEMGAVPNLAISCLDWPEIPLLPTPLGRKRDGCCMVALKEIYTRYFREYTEGS